MLTSRALFIPVILATPRQGRMSEYVAHFELEEPHQKESDDDRRRKATPRIA